MNFKHIGEEDYSYIHVGSWDQGGLKMNDEEIWSNSSDFIQSVCSEPCQKAQIKVSMDEACLERNVGRCIFCLFVETEPIFYLFIIYATELKQNVPFHRQ